MNALSKPSRRFVLAGTLVSLGFYLFIVWCEAAVHAGNIGFSEKPGWSRLLGTFAEVRPEHLARVHWGAWDIMTCTGMMAAVAGCLLLPRGTRDYRRLLAGYAILLVVMGGWAGLVMLLHLPYLLLVNLHDVDGEFFTDIEGRMLAYGAWTATVLLWTSTAFLTIRPRKYSSLPA